MQCQKCTSDNTQRLEVAYEDGTQNIQTSSRTTGVGLGRGGIGVGAASTTTSGVSRSLLASRAAPPRKRRYLFIVFTAFLAWLLWTASTRFSLWFFISIAVMVVCAGLAVMVFRFNANVWPEQMAYWRNQWICLKCGHIYHVE